MKLLVFLGKACSLGDRRARASVPAKTRPFKYSDETVGHIKWYLTDGKTHNEIARLCGVTAGYVCQVRDELVRAHIKPLKP